MSSNWKKDLDESLRIVKNGFLTGDTHTEFRFSSEQDDPNAEVKNALKKKRLYAFAFVFLLVSGRIIGVVEEGIWRLLRIPVHGTTSMLIRYEKNGKACAFSNLMLTRREKDHNDRYCDKAVFVGQAYMLHYKFNMQGTVRIMTTKQWMGKERLDGFKKQDMDREEKIETENEVFNGQFDVYATDAHTAFYVVTPIVMERLLAMKAKYGSFGVAVSGGEIVIALCSGYCLFEPPESYQEIENISVENSKDEIQQMLLFAQLLEDTINGRTGSDSTLTNGKQ